MRHVLILAVALVVLVAVARVATAPRPDADCIAWQETWTSENGRLAPAPDTCIAHATPQP